MSTLDTAKLLGFRHLPTMTGDSRKAMNQIDRALVKRGGDEVPPDEFLLASVSRAFTKLGDGEVPV